MSKGTDSFGGMPVQEAERFMALLLAAQKTRHKCQWCQYFKEVGERIMKQYVAETGGNE